MTDKNKWQLSPSDNMFDLFAEIYDYVLTEAEIKDLLTHKSANDLILIEKCYDYINAVTQKQGFLFPIKTLYGDGSRFENNYTVFESVYNKIKKYLNS